MTEKIKSKTRSLLDGIRKYNEKREQNSEKYKKLNIVLMILFPLFIVAMAEINQFKKIGSFLAFTVERPTVLIFNYIAAGIVFKTRTLSK